MHPRAVEENIDRSAMHRELQRAIPGLDDMYRLVHALIASRATNGSRLLIVGAGGGREFEELSRNELALDIAAIDPSEQNLESAKRTAEKTGLSDRVAFFKGTVADLHSTRPFDMATSLLVMHYIGDDGSKLAYLTSIRNRLSRNGVLIHADICFDGVAELEALMPAYLAHAELAGVGDHATRFEIEAIRRLPIISEARTCALFEEAGFTTPREVFRSLWYRCWISSRAAR